MPARLAPPSPGWLRAGSGVREDPEGCFALEVGKQGGSLGCLLSVQGGARCARIPAGLEPRACAYPGFLLRMGNLGIAASRELKPRASSSADKSVSCV